jgi:hypothetical protein
MPRIRTENVLHRSIPPPAETDPHLPVAIFWSIGGCTLQQAVGRIPSRKSAFGEGSHWRISTGDVNKIAFERPLSKMRQCAIDPLQS